MNIEDLTEGLKSQFNSPLFVSIALTFFALNWQALFLLFVGTGGAEERLMQFNVRTNIWSLTIFPLFGGFTVATFSPYLRLASSRLTRWAYKKKTLQDHDTDHEISVARLNDERDLFVKRTALANQIKEYEQSRDEISDPDLVQQFEDAIATTSSNADELTQMHGPPEERIGGYEWLASSTPSSLNFAKQRAKDEDKPLFLVAYDSNAPHHGAIKWSANHFFELQETRDLIKEHFIVFLSHYVKGHFTNDVPDEISKEKPVYIVYDTRGNVAKVDRLVGNGDDGLKHVKSALSFFN